MKISTMEIIRDLSKLNKNDSVIAGGKGASLGEMIQAGISVPPGFVILSIAFEKFLKETDLNVEIDSILDSVNRKEIHTIEKASEKIQALILGAEMPQDITTEIQKFFKILNSKYVAVRSSATAEDSASAAWAGQLESYLNTTEEALLKNVKKCWASLFTPRSIFYRFEKSLHNKKISVGVVVQKMIESEKSGIAFSVHPVTQDRNQLIIEAGLGLGEAIVSGQITPDSYVVEKQPRRIIDKNTQTQKSILSDKEIVELSELILKIEEHFGFPCDIEWAFEKGNIFIVQSRPITTLSNHPSLEGKMTFIAKRYTDPFEASLRVKSWSDGLEKELGMGYKTVVINSDGEYFVDSDSENKITQTLKLKTTKDALGYIDKIYDLKNKLLTKIKAEKYSEIEQDFSDLYTYFFIARRISENVYEKYNPKNQKIIENWRNDDTLFEPLDLYNKLNPQNNFIGEWSVVFNNGGIYRIDKKLTWQQKEVKEKDANIIRGKTAYPGFVKGKVRLITSKDNLGVIQDGEILVTNMTTPEFVPALKKVAAFITDEGGITSHAAIVSRELKKPCIIGTKNATKKLKNGDKVEVDATNGVVKIIK